MKFRFGCVLTLISCSLVAGCKADPTASAAIAPDAAANSAPAPDTAPASETIVAKIYDDSINLADLEKPLIETYGLNVLLGLVEMDLARQEASRQGVPAATPADIEDETTRTLTTLRRAMAAKQPDAAGINDDKPMTPAERDQLLQGILTNRRMTRGEFDIAMTTNFYLRKLVTPAVNADLKEEFVVQRFNAEYGEKAHVKFIRLPNMGAATAVLGELQKGRTFDEEIALHRFDNATTGDPRPTVGAMDFSRQDINLSPAFKEAAFDLKPGEVSSAIALADSDYLLQLDHLIPPQHAKYDDYKDAVRAELLETGIQGRMARSRQQIDDMIRQHLDVREPTLAKQWNDNLTKMNQLRSAQELKDKMAQQQTDQLSHDPATVPADQSPGQMPSFNLPAPATPPQQAPATQPAAASPMP